MRAAEFMRALADLIDALDGKDDKEIEAKADSKPDVFMSPQQQEIELAKAEQGKDSIAAAQLLDDPEEDEIA